MALNKVLPLQLKSQPFSGRPKASNFLLRDYFHHVAFGRFLIIDVPKDGEQVRNIPNFSIQQQIMCAQSFNQYFLSSVSHVSHQYDVISPHKSQHLKDEKSHNYSLFCLPF